LLDLGKKFGPGGAEDGRPLLDDQHGRHQAQATATDPLGSGATTARRSALRVLKAEAVRFSLTATENR
jgi:hypothetical protein